MSVVEELRAMLAKDMSELVWHAELDRVREALPLLFAAADAGRLVVEESCLSARRIPRPETIHALADALAPLYAEDR